MIMYKHRFRNYMFLFSALLWVCLRCVIPLAVLNWFVDQWPRSDWICCWTEDERGLEQDGFPHAITRMIHSSATQRGFQHVPRFQL